MRIWVTKCALTMGIREYGSANLLAADTVASVWIEGRQHFFYDNDWHRTRQDAVVRANEMVHQRIGSLLKQVDKLRAKKFE